MDPIRYSNVLTKQGGVARLLIKKGAAPKVPSRLTRNIWNIFQEWGLGFGSRASMKTRVMPDGTKMTTLDRWARYRKHLEDKYPNKYKTTVWDRIKNFAVGEGGDIFFHFPGAYRLGRVANMLGLKGVGKWTTRLSKRLQARSYRGLLPGSVPGVIRALPPIGMFLAINSVMPIPSIYGVKDGVLDTFGIMRHGRDRYGLQNARELYENDFQAALQDWYKNMTFKDHLQMFTDPNAYNSRLAAYLDENIKGNLSWFNFAKRKAYDSMRDSIIKRMHQNRFGIAFSSLLGNEAQQDAIFTKYKQLGGRVFDEMNDRVLDGEKLDDVLNDINSRKEL